MKKILLTLSLAFSGAAVFSQAVVSDSVTLGASYADQVFYQLSTQTKTTASNTDWDIAFNTSLFSVSARINAGKGVELYLPSNSDTANFTTTTIDTVAALRLRDGYDSWLESSSSFASVGSGHPDYGWVKYQGMGNLVGTRVFIMKTTGGDWKKFQLVSGTNTGTYTVRFADLDGTNIAYQSLAKSSYSSKLNMYFDIDANTVLDLEPNATDWDFVVRTYEENLGGGTYYNVTGVLSNDGVGVAEARGIAVTDAKANWSSYALDSSLNVIGHDWKSYDFSLGWVIEDSLSYIIQDKAQNVYQVIFTGWSGSATGKGYFTVEQMSATNIEENNGIATMGVYPNPTQNQLTLTYQLNNPQRIAFSIMDLSGKVVKSFNGEQNTSVNITNVDVSNLPKGTYILIAKTNSGVSTEKFVKL